MIEKRWGLLLLLAGAQAQDSVHMAQFDLGRTAAYTLENTLKPSNVNSTQFGKLFSRNVDASQYAQPLIAGNLLVGGSRRRRNVLFVATMANSVYAFDADSPSAAAPLWSRNLGPAQPYGPFLGPVTWGILSTPFIDRATNTIYVVANVAGTAPGLYLHALDLSTGASKFNSGVQMSFPYGSGTVTSQSSLIQRPGLLVSGGILYVAVANVLPDPQDSHTQEGYVQAFSATNLATRLASFQVTPTGLKGGVWQAGRGIAADANGDIYVATAGASYDGVTNFGSSLLKLSGSSLTLLDWFTPANHQFLYDNNLDPSANGAMLIPGTNLALLGGKTGKIYVANRFGMGHLEGGSGPVQQFQATQGCGVTDCAQTPGTAFWNNTLYIWDARDRLRAFPFNGSTFQTTPVTSTFTVQWSGGPSVSANGSASATGVVWAITTDQNAFDATVPGTLRAFRATNVAEELYNSGQNAARDAMGNFTKMAAPTIANGKVYVPTQDNRVQVYGLLR